MCYSAYTFMPVRNTKSKVIAEAGSKIIAIKELGLYC